MLIMTDDLEKVSDKLSLQVQSIINMYIIFINTKKLLFFFIYTFSCVFTERGTRPKSSIVIHILVLITLK